MAPAMINSPWTPAQVQALNRWQGAGFVHPFSCTTEHPEGRELVATVMGWVCPYCNHKSYSAPAFMFEPLQNPMANLSRMGVNGEERTHLIWSGKWGAWHRRSDSGVAAGYVNDLLQAGVFETSTAMAYHDDGDEPDRNTALALEEVAERMEKRLASFEAEIADKRAFFPHGQ